MNRQKASQELNPRALYATQSKRNLPSEIMSSNEHDLFVCVRSCNMRNHETYVRSAGITRNHAASAASYQIRPATQAAFVPQQEAFRGTHLSFDFFLPSTELSFLCAVLLLWFSCVLCDWGSWMGSGRPAVRLYGDFFAEESSPPLLKRPITGEMGGCKPARGCTLRVERNR